MMAWLEEHEWAMNTVYGVCLLLALGLVVSGVLGIQEHREEQRQKERDDFADCVDRGNDPNWCFTLKDNNR